MPRTRPTPAATTSAITRPVRFMPLIPRAPLAEEPHESKSARTPRLRPFPGAGTCSDKCKDEQLLRPGRLLAADLDLSLVLQRRPPVPASIAPGERGADRDQQGHAANATGFGASIGFGDRLHAPS